MRRALLLCCVLLSVSALPGHAIIAFEPGGFFCYCFSPCDPLTSRQFCIGVDMPESPTGTVPVNGTLLIEAMREGYAGVDGYAGCSPLTFYATEMLATPPVHGNPKGVSFDSTTLMGYARVHDFCDSDVGSPWFWSIDGHRWRTTECEQIDGEWEPKFHNGAYRLHVGATGWFWGPGTPPAAPCGSLGTRDAEAPGSFEKTVAVENMLMSVDESCPRVLAWSPGGSTFALPVTLTDGGPFGDTTITLKIRRLSDGLLVRTIETPAAGPGTAPTPPDQLWELEAEVEWDGTLADNTTPAAKGIYVYELTATHPEKDWTCSGESQPPLYWEDCDCGLAERTAGPESPYDGEAYLDRDNRTSHELKITGCSAETNGSAVELTYTLSSDAQSCGFRVYGPNLALIQDTPLTSSEYLTAGKHAVTVNMTPQPLQPYYFVVYATDPSLNNKGHVHKPALETGALLNGIPQVSFTPNGWSQVDGEVRFAGGQAGSAEFVCPVDYDDPANTSHEYEFSYTVHSPVFRQSGQNWRTPWFELHVNGAQPESKPFFGDDQERKRRVRFWIEDGQTTATLRFESEASCTSSATFKDFRFRRVDSIPRDTALDVPYTGYNLVTPPGGGCVDGWTSGYNDTDMQAWIDTVAEDPVTQETKPLLLRVFMMLDQGMANFDDDDWRMYPDTTGDLVPDAKYLNDPPGASYPWVTRPGEGYRRRTGLSHGFSDEYVARVNAFLSKCDANNFKVIPVLFWPLADWKNIPAKNGVRAPVFRKTTFDKEGDNLVYRGTDPVIPKYASPGLVDHQDMRDNYLVAIEDWLNLFLLDAQGQPKHPCVWGIDIMNEPFAFLGYGTWNVGGVTEYTWHGIGPETKDSEYWVQPIHYTHRLRDFLAAAYDVVDTWRQVAGRPWIQVVSDVNGEHYAFERNHIDMDHPWDGENRVRKVCDVFGLHWYQKYPDVQNPTYIEWTHMWSSDRLQPWRTDEGSGLQRPQTDWMAEKPIILAETNRYANYDWGGEFVGETWFEGTGVCNGSFGYLVCNEHWYPGYLDRGKPRHIESYVMWVGDGPRWTQHLVQGQYLSPTYGLEGYGYGWGRYMEGPNAGYYRLGTGGEAVRDYDPDE